MATCCLCNKSGWFMKTSADGLCEVCEATLEMDIEQHGRIITESVKLINTSANLSTRLSRIGVAINSCQALRRYELHGLKTIQTPPSDAISELYQAREAMIIEAINNELIKAKTKSENAATPAGKVSPYSRVIDKIASLYQELDDVTCLEQLEVETRAEMDKARLKAELEKAEKAEFRGQKKRALTAYLDALFCLTKDTIDDKLQKRERALIESKIKELGGEIPNLDAP